MNTAPDHTSRHAPPADASSSPDLARRLAAGEPPPESLDAEIESMPEGGAVVDLRSRRHAHAGALVVAGGVFTAASVAVSGYILYHRVEAPLAVIVLLILGLGGGLIAFGLGLVTSQQRFRFEFHHDHFTLDRPWRRRDRWPVDRACAVTVMSDEPAVTPPVPGALGQRSGMTKLRLYFDDHWIDIRGGLSPAEHAWFAAMLAAALNVPFKREVAL